jgi:hypothetical protein
MRCPQCDYHSEYVRCPQCARNFAAADLEELGHLLYLRKWLLERARDELLSTAVWADLLDKIDSQQPVVEAALGLHHPQPAPAAPAAHERPERLEVAPAGHERPERLEVPHAQPTTSASREPSSSLRDAPGPAPLRAASSAQADVPARPPARPAFAWSDVGIYLLSERTLHALLGLGALLILASGVVISTLNPTGLSPAPHLAAVMCTTALFYAAGYFVRQRLGLTLTGAALLAIGGGFIPLTVWTLGQELLHWEPGAIWLAASVLCLPVYLASHAVLRDRMFAVLTAVTGGSELLALSHWLGVPLEWGLLLLIGLACAYVWLGHRLTESWHALAWGLAWTAQAAVPLVMVALLGAKFFPTAWEVAARQPLGAWYEYAIGAAWWLGAGFFALAASLIQRSYLRFLAAWTVPVAYLLTLTKAPWDAVWHSVALAILAGAYIVYGRWRLTAPPRSYRSVAGEPVYQAALAMTLLAAAWPARNLDSQTATLLVVALVYAAAAMLLRQRAWAYVAVYLLPIAYASLLEQMRLDAVLRPLAWTGLAATLLAAAEVAVRRTREALRPLVATILGLDGWRSRFGSPLFSAGYAIGAFALAIACGQYANAPAANGVRQLDTAGILAFVVLVGLATLSSVSRRAAVFLYASTWLFLIPFTAAAGRIFAALGLPLPQAELARLLAVLDVGYLVLAYAIERIGARYARPVYLVGYVLSLATMPLSALDRALNVQLVGLSIAVYSVSAWLVHSRRHLAYLALVRRLFTDPESPAFHHARALFLYLTAWLFPVWLLLAMSLRWPAPTMADYGIALTLLAPVYAATGLGARRIRAEYRWPWYLAGYALSVIGPLVAASDLNRRLLALAVSIGLYIASTLVSRRSVWLYLVALLTPLLVWQGLDRLDVPSRVNGLALVVLAVVYCGLGVVLHHGLGNPRRFARPIGKSMGAFARPFFLVGYGLCALGLALVADQNRDLVVLTFVLAAAQFAVSAFVFRLSLFGYPLVGTAAVAYLVGMTLTPLDSHYYGLGLLPGLLASLATAEVLRRRLDARRAAPVPALTVERWATPFYLLTYIGTVAVPAWSGAEQSIWTAAWWAVSVIYALSVALFGRPAWLYPTLGTALVAWLATAHTLAPSLSLTDALATLVAPAWLLFGAAFIMARRLTSAAWPTLEALGSPARLLAPRWPDPLAAFGWVALGLSVGSAVDPGAGLRSGVAAALLLALLGTLWRGRAEVWASLLAAAVAFQDTLRVLAIPIVDQPPRWALAALVLSLVAIALRRQSWSMLAVWPRPLYMGAIAAGAAAVLWALDLQFASATRGALQPLSATVALSGLTLVAHGFDRHERMLVYQGVALLEIGYMLQLVFFDVGQPQAFALPAGLYLLGVAFLEWRRGNDSRVKSVLELAGLAILLGVSLVQAVGWLGAGLDHYAYATFLVIESVALFGLAAVVHWRRSFFAGALALVLDVGILLADPLRSLNTWYLVAVIGLTMIAAVIFIEQRRQQIPFWLHDWRQRLENWD